MRQKKWRDCTALVWPADSLEVSRQRAVCTVIYSANHIGRVLSATAKRSRELLGHLTFVENIGEQRIRFGSEACLASLEQETESL